MCPHISTLPASVSGEMNNRSAQCATRELFELHELHLNFAKFKKRRAFLKMVRNFLLKKFYTGRFP